MAKVMIVDDEGKIRALLAMALNAEGFELCEAESAETALENFVNETPDVIISDVRMNGMSGLDLLGQIKTLYPTVEVIIMTAHADGETGVEAMRKGAFEYVAKPFEMDEMILVVKSAVERISLKNNVKELREKLQENYSIKSIIGISDEIKNVFKQITMVGKKDTTILITGKSGTGKELVARAIHSESQRDDFLAINCGAIPENLLASELFGHEKGAFTGAGSKKVGYFEKAGNGTLFLDEIGEISPKIQVNLLRVLQEKTFMRVGGTEVLKNRARIITATNRNLTEAIEFGEFREDLFYRLNVFPIAIPKLSQRKIDIPLLINHFIKKYKGKSISQDALNCLQNYSWPGNVRELENIIERALILSEDNNITFENIPDVIMQPGGTKKSDYYFTLPEIGIDLDQVEKEFLLQAIKIAKGNKSKAAELLKISRRAIYSKMKTHRIDD